MTIRHFCKITKHGKSRRLANILVFMRFVKNHSIQYTSTMFLVNVHGIIEYCVHSVTWQFWSL